MNQYYSRTVLAKRDIDIVRQAAKIISEILARAKEYVRPGVSTLDLDEFIYKNITEFGCEPILKGYRGYPACSCISIDDELTHGVPKKNKIVQCGQLVSIDLSIRYKGFCADIATTMYLDSPDIETSKKEKILSLLQTTYRSIHYTLPIIRSECSTKEIGKLIEEYISSHGLNIVHEYGGHAIGKNLHEDPSIPNFGDWHKHQILIANTVICLEPMASLGSKWTFIDDDGWTIRTKDRSLCAHFEHMILVKDDGAEILTDDEVVKPTVLNF